MNKATFVQLLRQKGENAGITVNPDLSFPVLDGKAVYVVAKIGCKCRFELFSPVGDTQLPELSSVYLATKLAQKVALNGYKTKHLFSLRDQGLSLIHIYTEAIFECKGSCIESAMDIIVDVIAEFNSKTSDQHVEYLMNLWSKKQIDISTTNWIHPAIRYIKIDDINANPIDYAMLELAHSRLSQGEKVLLKLIREYAQSRIA